MSTLDSEGHRHLSGAGFSDLGATPTSLIHAFDFSNEDFFAQGRTKCMRYNYDTAADDIDGLEAKWSAEGCSTAYLQDAVPATIRCSCDSLNDDIHAIITEVIVGPGAPGGGLAAVQQDAEGGGPILIMLILVPLFTVGVVIPFVVMRLDKTDLAHVQSG